MSVSPPEMPPSAVATAQAYLDRGWVPIPLCWPSSQGQCGCPREGHTGRDVGKAPLLGAGYQHTTADEVEVARWWGERWPRANVGLLLEPSGLLIIDADSKEAVEEVERRGSEAAPWVKTGKGRHYYYMLPGGVKPGRRTATGDSGKIDILAKGYVVAPPSTHSTGRLYAWSGGGALTDAPAWAIALLHPPRPVQAPRNQRSFGEWQGDAGTDPERIRSALSSLDPNMSNDEWVRVGMAIHDAHPGSTGTALWDEWSRGGGSYKPGVCDKRWRSFTSGSVGIATLFSLAFAAGWKDPTKRDRKRPTPRPRTASGSNPEQPPEVLVALEAVKALDGPDRKAAAVSLAREIATSTAHQDELAAMTAGDRLAVWWGLEGAGLTKGASAQVQKALEEDGVFERSADPEPTSTWSDSDEREELLLEGDLHSQSMQLLEELDLANDPPRWFQMGCEPVRVIDDPRHGARLATFDAASLRALVQSRWRLLRNKALPDGGYAQVPTNLPLALATHILAYDDTPFPLCDRVIAAPTFAPSGRFVSERGYAPELQAYLDPRAFGPLELPERVTRDDVEASVVLLLDEWLGDFPFAGGTPLEVESSKAHALALGLTPLVRPMIDDVTPLFLIDAPTEGTGKSMVAELLGEVVTGAKPKVLTEGKDDEEWRKRITSMLRTAPSMVILDNVNKDLNSGNLASMITTTVWEDRLLGASEIITLDNRAAWVATANNPSMTGELARRVVWIHLDAKEESPEQRTGFRHTHIKRWTREHRDRLLLAFATMVRWWQQQGSPVASVRFGSFEIWAEVVGGILEAAGVKGFLANRDTLKSRANAKGAEWVAFVRAWWDAAGRNAMGAGDLAKLASDNELLLDVLGDKSERSQASRLGKALAKKIDRVFDGRTIRGGFNGNRKVNFYTLEEVSAHV